jgi:hypothetical protein
MKASPPPDHQRAGLGRQQLLRAAGLGIPGLAMSAPLLPAYSSIGADDGGGPLAPIREGIQCDVDRAVGRSGIDTG